MNKHHHSKTFVLPNNAKNLQINDPLSSMLYITDCGYYHKMDRHNRERKKGAKEYILIYCIDGKGWYSIKGGAKQQVCKNDFFILEANTAHHYAADTKYPWSIYWIHFKGEKASLFKDLFNTTLNIYTSVFERKEMRMTIFEEIMANFEDGYNLENIQYSSLCLWYLLGTFRYVEQFRKINKIRDNDPIKKAISYMKQNIHLSLTLDDIAKHIGYSASHFGVLFADKVGQTPIEYLNTLKIKEACQQLQFSQQYIKEIAYSLGYNNQYYFCKVFKKVMGMTPTTYRNLNIG